MSTDFEWTRELARERPVREACVWCKVPGEESSVPFRRIGNGPDHICDNCLRDLRMFKRFEWVQIWVATGLEPAVKRVVMDAWSDHVQPELDDLYTDHPDLYQLPRFISNATKHEYPD